MNRGFPSTVRWVIFVAALMLLGNVFAQPTRAAGITVTLLAQGGNVFRAPLDASPSPDGKMVYFVAETVSGEAGIFRVSSSGGAVETLLAGAPLAAPHSLVVSTDGQTLYIADPAS